MRAVLVAVVVLWLGSVPAFASTISYSFTGSISSPGLGLNAGATISGVVTFDPLLPFYNSQPTFAQYAQGTLTYTVVNPGIALGDPAAQAISGGLTINPGLQINNNSSTGSGVADVFNLQGAAANDGGAVGDFAPNFLTFSLIDSSTNPDAFSSPLLTDLPTLMLSDFDFAGLIFDGPSGSVLFNINSLTAVPLPAGIWLFLTALGFLGQRRLRQGCAAIA